MDEARSDGPPERDPEARWGATRLLIGAGVGLLVMAAAAQMAGGEGFFLVVLVPTAVAAAMAWRLRGFAAIPLLLFSLMLVMLGSGDAGIHLRAVDTYPEFVPAVAVPVGAGLLVIGSLWSIVSRVFGRAPHPVSRPLRVVVYAVAGAVLAASAASIVISVASPSTVPTSDRAGALRIVMPDDSYSLKEIEMRRGETLRILLDNTDRSTHTLTIDELDVDEIVSGRRQRLVRLRSTLRGTLTYYCRVSGHDDQRGTLVVR